MECLLALTKLVYLKVQLKMKTDIVTLAIVVFCVGVFISALDLGELFSVESNDQVVAVEAR